jgi:hypothetical protein
MSDDVRICAVCGKEYRRKYASDYPEDQWWQNISRCVVGGVCSPGCAEKTPEYVNRLREIMKFYQTFTPEQRAGLDDFIEAVEDDLYCKYSMEHVLGGPIPEEKVYCFTCRRIFNISETEHIGDGQRQCKACSEKETCE